MLSPEQFNKIVLKEDLDKILDAKFDEKLTPLVNAIDSLVKVVSDLKSEFASNVVAHDRFETRITHLEKTLL
jgi:hypothetical protein